MEETKLVQAALEGDEAAFEALVKKYYRKVYQLAVSITNNPAEAEDLAQEVFIKVYSSLSQFQGQSSFGTWLYQVILNHGRDFLRQKRRRATDSWSRKKTTSVWPASASQEKSLEAQQLILKALSKLSDKLRMIIILKDIHGFSYEEIAKILKISLGTVDSRLHRARRKLRQELLPFWRAKEDTHEMP